MFESLSDRFESVLGKLKGKGKLSEADVDDALREIRLALLEADVNFTVVKNFCARVRDRAVGEEVSKALNPGQQMVKIVNRIRAAEAPPPAVTPEDIVLLREIRDSLQNKKVN